MKTRLWLIVLGWLLATSAEAQFLAPPQTITAAGSGTACVTVRASCAIFPVDVSSSFAFDVSGTWTGTLTFEGTANDGVWRTIQTTNTADGSTATVANANGTFGMSNVGLISARVRVTSGMWSGSAVITATRGYATGLRSSSGGGGGEPGGATNSIQYNAGSSTFGGSTTLSTVGGALLSTGTGTWFANVPTDQTSGSFQQVVGVASNDADPRPDHTMILGWNVSGGVSGAGSNGLSFESYCSLGTGCLAGNGGQSETYFSLDDGKGSSVRPLGFFQRKFDDNTSHYAYTIARSDAWGFWDRAFTYPIFSIDDNAAVGGLRTFDSLISSSLTNATLITISGNAALGISSAGIEVGRAGSVDLAPGGDASGKVRAVSNHFQLTSGGIEDVSNSEVRVSFGAGDSARHLSLANTPGAVLVGIAGTETNPDIEFDLKGNGRFVVNPLGGSGVARLYPHVVFGDDNGGVTSTTTNSCGTTAPTIAGSDVAGKVTVGATSGTSCTVTFDHSWATAPSCQANGALYTRVTSTTSGFVLTGTFGAGEVISYLCIGGQ